MWQNVIKYKQRILEVSNMKENSQEKYMEIIRQLVDLGAYSTNTLNEVLQLAVEGGYTELVKFLIERGADVTADDNQAIIIAAKGGNNEVIELLLEKGADVEARHNLVIYRAIISGKIEVVKLLLEKGANLAECYTVDLLLSAVEIGNKELVEVLLENGADVTEVWPYELLESPVNCGNIGLVKLLIEHGVVETDCFSLILDAINGGYEKVVKILIKYADEKTKKAKGLLEAAIENKNLKIIKILLENGADIEILKQKDMQLALLYDPNIILKDIIKYLL